MSTKKIVKLTDAVITQYLTGPDAAGELRRCILCRGEFAEGERWLKMTRPGQYSVGAHTSCMARKGSEVDGVIATESRLRPITPARGTSRQ